VQRRFLYHSGAFLPRFGRLAAAVLLVLFAVPLTPGRADEPLPVPRFATLRADAVNLRTGPGDRYPIDWVFTRKGMPVEILGEYDVWRKVRDWQGTEGWVHERMLAGTRTVIVRGETRPLHSDPDPNSPVVARADQGVIAKLLECQGPWCRIEAHDAVQTAGGWLRRSEIWGVYPEEDVK
jgi:SH3-like domain-containing protein